MPQLKRSTERERRSAILQASAEVFFKLGYAATSIDAIIERLGGSKRDIYKAFGSKEGLFTALVSESTDNVLKALAVDQIEERDLRTMLTDFGERLMVVFTSPTTLGVYRIIVTEAPRFPELARTFYDKGPGRAAARLAEVLQTAVEKGEVKLDDCGMAASHFVGMLRDNLHLSLVLGIRPMPTNEEKDRTVASAVEIFLNGIRLR